MNRSLIAAVAAVGVVATPVFAQSAKFAAVWTDDLKVVQSRDCATTDAEFCDDVEILGDDMGITLANIKVPNSKELLVGISAQVELFTQTIVKGKRGSYSKATALAEGGVDLMACNQASGTCYEAEPGYITLSSRQQELEAVLGGVIEECTFDVALDIDYGDEGVEDDQATGSATWTLDDCVVKQEEIGLALTTMAAHHFNFVFPDLPQGDYAVIATFDTHADAAAEESCADGMTYCDSGDGDAMAISHAVIGKTMMTVQEVRAVKGSLGSMEFLIEVP
jgi:hypothetical protein